MRTVIIAQPPSEIEAWLRARRAKGQDLFDEVWEGEYHVAPAPHPRHGQLDGEISERLGPRARQAGLVHSGPLNIGDPDNYRVPDRAFLRERPRATFVPTAAIVVEIASPDDETYEKFEFYFERGVEELLVVDGAPGTVEWYTRGEGAFERTATSRLLSLTEAELSADIDWPPAS